MVNLTMASCHTSCRQCNVKGDLDLTVGAGIQHQAGPPDAIAIFVQAKVSSPAASSISMEVWHQRQARSSQAKSRRPVQLSSMLHMYSASPKVPHHSLQCVVA